MAHHNLFLESERLYFRALELSDVPKCLTWINDPEIRQFVTCHFPVGEAAERAWIEFSGKGNPPRDIAFAMVLKDDGRHIGNVELHGIDWVHRHASTGTLIGEKDCWSQGYGTEAKRLLLRYAFDELGLHRLSSTVFASNLRSLACQLKCGYVEEGRRRVARLVNGVWTDEVMLGVLADEWRASHGKD